MNKGLRVLKYSLFLMVGLSSVNIGYSMERVEPDLSSEFRKLRHRQLSSSERGDLHDICHNHTENLQIAFLANMEWGELSTDVLKRAKKFYNNKGLDAALKCLLNAIKDNYVPTEGKSKQQVAALLKPHVSSILKEEFGSVGKESLNAKQQKIYLTKNAVEECAESILKSLCPTEDGKYALRAEWLDSANPKHEATSPKRLERELAALQKARSLDDVSVSNVRNWIAHCLKQLEDPATLTLSPYQLAEELVSELKHRNGYARSVLNKTAALTPSDQIRIDRLRVTDRQICIDRIRELLFEDRKAIKDEQNKITPEDVKILSFEAGRERTSRLLAKKFRETRVINLGNMSARISQLSDKNKQDEAEALLRDLGESLNQFEVLHRKVSKASTDVELHKLKEAFSSVYQKAFESYLALKSTLPKKVTITDSESKKDDLYLMSKKSKRGKVIKGKVRESLRDNPGSNNNIEQAPDEDSSSGEEESYKPIKFKLGNIAETIFLQSQQVNIPDYPIKKALELLNILDGAEGDLFELLGNLTSGADLHKLKDDRVGQYAIKINDRWRICFTVGENSFENVEIVDYH